MGWASRTRCEVFGSAWGEVVQVWSKHASYVVGLWLVPKLSSRALPLSEARSVGIISPASPTCALRVGSRLCFFSTLYWKYTQKKISVITVWLTGWQTNENAQGKQLKEAGWFLDRQVSSKVWFETSPNRKVLVNQSRQRESIFYWLNLYRFHCSNFRIIIHDLYGVS